MNALKSENPVAEYKKREHRVSKLPFKDVLTMHLDKIKKDDGLGNVDFARAIGYTMPNVVAMMKSGSMRLPVNKIADAAKFLKLDTTFLMIKVIEENNPDLADLIKSVMGKSLVSENEMKLVHLVRNELDGYDIDLTNDAGLTQPLISAVQKLRVREEKENLATMERIERDKMAKVAKK